LAAPVKNNFLRCSVFDGFEGKIHRTGSRRTEDSEKKKARGWSRAFQRRRLTLAESERHGHDGASANVKTNHDQRIPLLFAARDGNAEMAKLQIDAKADVNAKDRVGRNALKLG
jgi:hypothetical protein